MGLVPLVDNGEYSPKLQIMRSNYRLGKATRLFKEESRFLALMGHREYFRRLGV